MFYYVVQWWPIDLGLLGTLIMLNLGACYFSLQGFFITIGLISLAMLVLHCIGKQGNKLYED